MPKLQGPRKFIAWPHVGNAGVGSHRREKRCVRERERERESERDRARESEGDSERDRARDSESRNERGRASESERDSVRDRARESDRALLPGVVDLFVKERNEERNKKGGKWGRCAMGR